jgi:hypothetical protein
MPTLDPRFAGLTSGDRLEHAALVAQPVSLEHDLVVADRQTLGGEHQLHRGLVHADCRCQHAGADIRNVRELEQSLHRPVFSVRTMQHREHHIEGQARNGDLGSPGLSFGAGQCQQRLRPWIGDEVRLTQTAIRTFTGRRRRLELRGGDHVGRLHGSGRFRRECPASVLFDPDRDRFVAIGVEVLEHRRRRRERHLVFARAAAIYDADSKFLHVRETLHHCGHGGLGGTNP